MKSAAIKNTSSMKEQRRHASQFGNHAFPKLTQRAEQALHESSQTNPETKELESVSRQHPDLFRETARQALWDGSRAPIQSGAIQTRAQAIHLGISQGMIEVH